MTLRTEEVELFIKLWNEGYTSSEISRKYKEVLGVHITPIAVKSRGAVFAERGLITKRKAGWQHRKGSNV